MAKERLYLFDTTLRDGAQTQGVVFSVADKRRIAAALDELGIDYIEGGHPGDNDTDTAFFAVRPVFKQARFTAFGITRRAGRTVAHDWALQAVLRSQAEAVCLVAKAWDYHVRVSLGITNEENVRSVVDSVKAVREAGKEPLIDCEHFFDGYKGNRKHAVAVARAAYESGARWVVLCDTNGGTLPNEIAEIVRDVTRHVPGTSLGIHTHNDTEQAVANSLAAVRAGCRQIQGALNGVGERCGNANLTSIIPTLMLRSEFADRFEIGVTPDRLCKLSHASRVLEEVLSRAPDRQAPVYGEGAFAAPAGIPIVTDGDRQRGPIPNVTGKLNILPELDRLGIRFDGDDPRATRFLEEIRDKEAGGYTYEGATASLELLARRFMGEVPKYFAVDSFRVVVEKRNNAHGRMVSVAEAWVRLFINGDNVPVCSVSEGNGPVNALDQALRKDLGRYQPHIKNVELVDYKVRILTGGPEALTRVVVESRDRVSGERWFTVGVSPNIVDASFEALVDSINYTLLKNNAAVSHAAAS